MCLRRYRLYQTTFKVRMMNASLCLFAVDVLKEWLSSFLFSTAVTFMHIDEGRQTYVRLCSTELRTNKMRLERTATSKNNAFSNEQEQEEMTKFDTAQFCPKFIREKDSSHDQEFLSGHPN